jgi:nitric oxide synthase-interacting protein
LSIDLASIKQRLGGDSQLPFGYCALSTYPAEEPVVSPSGHLYSRESILEYLLVHSRRIKEQTRLYEEQTLKHEEEELQLLNKLQAEEQQHFAQSSDGVLATVNKRKLEQGSEESDYFQSRKKIIDDTEREVKLEELRKVSPWVPQFTPQAKESQIKEPPKRPPSPFTGRPLRAKDLIPVNLVRESDVDDSSRVRYICPVSR